MVWALQAPSLGRDLGKPAAFRFILQGFFSHFSLFLVGVLHLCCLKAVLRYRSPIKKVTYQRGLRSVGLIHHFM